MLTIKQGIKMSAIIDKLEIKITDPKATAEQVGADVMLQIASKAHKAEKEIYNFVAEIKKISVKEAEDVNLIEFIKEMVSNPDVLGFFKSAVK